MDLEAALGFSGQIHVCDIGAAAIAEVPPYKVLLDRRLARLTAIDGDERQAEAIRRAYGPATVVISEVIADGLEHTLYLAHPDTGMSSILEPSPAQLAFFNNFPVFGRVEKTLTVATSRLDDVAAAQDIDYLKMDIQGAELMVLENAAASLRHCVVIHLEASFIPLYNNQPTFGDVDRWMRANGFLPHCMPDLKRWSITPTINGELRRPFNQLLECDVVYVRGLTSLVHLSDEQVKKIALIAALCYSGPDLCLHAVAELERRGALPAGRSAQVLSIFNSG